MKKKKQLAEGEGEDWEPRYGNDSRPWLLGFSKDEPASTSTTTKDTFTADWPDKPRAEGIRRQLLREALWSQVKQEVTAEAARAEELLETSTEYKVSFAKDGFTPQPIKTDPELHRKYPLYGDSAVSLWKEKLPSLPGATRAPHVQHQFRRYTGFTTPLEQTLDIDPDLR